MDYQPIENYGIIGDLNTVALVGLNGSIDFMCFPDFDSPSIFSSLLDKNKGGYFQIVPVFGEMRNKQLYLPETNVLLTRFLSSEGVGELTDFMPAEELYIGHVLVRRLTNVKGTATYRMACCPRFNYARDSHQTEIIDDKTVLFHSNGETNLSIRLRSTVKIDLKENDAFAEFSLGLGETADFMLELYSKDQPDVALSLHEIITRELEETMEYWKSWMGLSKYKGRWQEIINRSALVLKLLTSHHFGSIVAAPTFSLPEHIGGGRNWDYRYTWIRDASFTLYAFINLGYTKEAGKFIKW